MSVNRRLPANESCTQSTKVLRDKHTPLTSVNDCYKSSHFASKIHFNEAILSKEISEVNIKTPQVRRSRLANKGSTSGTRNRSGHITRCRRVLTTRLGAVLLAYKTRRILFNVQDLRDARLAILDLEGLLRYLDEALTLTKDLSKKTFILDWVCEIKAKVLAQKKALQE